MAQFLVCPRFPAKNQTVIPKPCYMPTLRRACNATTSAGTTNWRDQSVNLPEKSWLDVSNDVPGTSHDVVRPDLMHPNSQPQVLQPFNQHDQCRPFVASRMANKYFMLPIIVLVTYLMCVEHKAAINQTA